MSSSRCWARVASGRDTAVARDAALDRHRRDAFDALMEAINGRYKAECIRTTVFHDSPNKTVADVEYATAGWVDISTTTEGSTRPWGTSHPSSTSKPTTPPSTASRAP